jgi:hypothetical protein
MALLEQRGAAVRLPRTGEVLPVHPSLFIAACDNTFGTGSDSGEYVARNPLGLTCSTACRSSCVSTTCPTRTNARCYAKPSPARPGASLPREAMAPIMKLMKNLPRQGRRGRASRCPSFRGAVAFATLLAFGQRPADAWTIAVVLGAPEPSHEALRLVFSTVWPTDATGNLTTFQGGI